MMDTDIIHFPYDNVYRVILLASGLRIKALSKNQTKKQTYMLAFYKQICITSVVRSLGSVRLRRPAFNHPEL